MGKFVAGVVAVLLMEGLLGVAWMASAQGTAPAKVAVVPKVAASVPGLPVNLAHGAQVIVTCAP